MSSATFDLLLILLGSSFMFQGTKMRDSLPPEERLAVTYGTRAQNVIRQSLLSRFLYFFYPNTVSVLRTICVYIHVSVLQRLYMNYRCYQITLQRNICAQIGSGAKC